MGSDERSMTSPRQWRANRQNAQRSTGPRTAPGKAVVARNALRHGLLAREIVLPEEDAAAFTVLHDQLVQRLSPGDVLEELCVERLAGLAWRLRRIPVLEAGLLVTGRPTGVERLALEEAGAVSTSARLGLAFAKRAGVLSMLARYEGMLERRFYKELHELERRQGLRAARATPVVITDTADGDVPALAEPDIGDEPR